MPSFDRKTTVAAGLRLTNSFHEFPLFAPYRHSYSQWTVAFFAAQESIRETYRAMLTVEGWCGSGNRKVKKEIESGELCCLW